MIRIVIADDHVIFRQGLLNLLRTADNIIVAGSAGTGSEAVALIEKERPDVAVLDISMPGLDGFSILEEAKKMSCPARIIFLTMHNDIPIVKRAIRRGAAGFVLKDNAFEDLIYAITAVYSGGVFISPSVSGRVVGNVEDDQKAPVLTVREREVLKLIASGLTNKQTASRLFISIKTVETHRTNLMQKLDIHTTADLVRYAMRTGILDK
jgi:DNA-binding NarL/FixJ family response regulator